MLMINEPKKPEKESEIEDDSSSTIQFIWSRVFRIVSVCDRFQ